MFLVSVMKNPCGVFEKLCGVQFLKHGCTVNFLARGLWTQF